MSLLKYLLGVSILLWGITSSGQLKLKDYKAIADKKVKPFFSNRVYKQIKCYSFFDEPKTGEDRLGGKYSANKKRLLNNPKYVLIFYLLYSKQFDYRFGFYVIIDSNMNASTPLGTDIPRRPNGAIEDIPECIRMDYSCKFISKQVAIKIAQKDSIQYPDNLLVEMKVSAKTNRVCWVISGQKKIDVDYSKPEPEDGWNIFPLEKKNTRFVDAITGNLIKYDEWQ